MYLYERTQYFNKFKCYKSIIFQFIPHNLSSSQPNNPEIYKLFMIWSAILFDRHIVVYK